MKNATKNTKRWALVGMLAVLGVLAMNVRGELPGLPPASENSIRPNSAPVPSVSMAPRGTIRGSLFRAGAEAPVPMGLDGQPITSAPVSFTAVTAPLPKKFKKNDIITIVVEEASDYSSSATGKSEKKQDYDMAIQQMIQIAQSASGLPTVGLVGNASKLPEIKFNYNNKRDNQASQQRTDNFTLRLSATIVDVKPNGTCVVEAVKKITVDREFQTFRLSGICRAEDVTVDNTVLSTQLADLTVSKQTTGEVHEGVRSGWLNKLIDRINPF